MNKFEVLEIIGEGTYGVVVKAFDKEAQEFVAIKRFKENGKSLIKRELKMLNNLRSCEFIVNLKEAYRRKEKIYFIFEYVDKSLLQVLQENKNGLNLSICKNLLFQLCKAIEKCHSMDIIHRDIKPENLLIDKSFNLKLCDFGFARQISRIEEEDEPFTEYVATRWYRSPELLLLCSYGKPVDIWAIGCIACEIITGKPLFPGNSDLDQLHKIILSLGALPQYQFEELKKNRRFINFKALNVVEKSNSFEMKFAPVMDEKLLSFTQGCLMLDPNARFDIKKCLRHGAFEAQIKSYVNRHSRVSCQSSVHAPSKPSSSPKAHEIVTTSELDAIKTQSNKSKRTITFNERDLLAKFTSTNQTHTPAKMSTKKATASDLSSSSSSPHNMNLKPLDLLQQTDSNNKLIKSFQEHRAKTNFYPFGNILNSQQQQQHNISSSLKDHLITDSLIINTNHTNKFIQSHEKSNNSHNRTFRLKPNPSGRTDESQILRKTPIMNRTVHITATPGDLLGSKQNLNDENREKSFIVKYKKMALGKLDARNDIQATKSKPVEKTKSILPKRSKSTLENYANPLTPTMMNSPLKFMKIEKTNAVYKPSLTPTLAYESNGVYNSNSFLPTDATNSRSDLNSLNFNQMTSNRLIFEILNLKSRKTPMPELDIV